MGEAAPTVPATADDPDDLTAFPAWARSVSDCQARLGVSISRGLSSAEATARLRAYGPNELAVDPGPSLLLDQFKEDTLVRILLAAAAVSFLLALSSSASSGATPPPRRSPLVIFLVLVVNAAVGVWQEANAERALDALPLREIQFHNTAVLRDDGAIHAQIHQASQEDDDAPLKKKLNEFGEALTKIIGLICALVWLINVKYSLTFELRRWVPRNVSFSFDKCTYCFEIAVAAYRGACNTP